MFSVVLVVKELIIHVMIHLVCRNTTTTVHKVVKDVKKKN